MTFGYTHLGVVTCDNEGVGSYGSAATPSANFEVRKDSAGIMHVPQRQPLDTLSPRRGGQAQVTTGKTTDAGFIARMRSATLAATDTVDPDLRAALRGAGFIEAFVAGPPRTLTFTLQDHPEAMDSCTVRQDNLHGTANAIRKLLDGVRWSAKVSASRGQPLVWEFAGKGQTYTDSDAGSAPSDLAYPSNAVLTLAGATLTLEVVGGSPSYSGPLEAFEIDYAMNVIEIGDGTSTGLVDQIQLQPTESFPFSVTVKENLIANWNNERIRDNNSQIHFKLVVPDLEVSSPTNVVEFDQYGTIESVERVQLAGGAMGSKLNMRSMWMHASAPGVTSATSATVVWKTTP